MSGTLSSSNGASAESLKNLGNSALAEENLPLAETFYRQALTANPGYMPAHYNLGNVLRQTGRYDEALISYQTAAGLAPDDYEIQVNIGVTLTEMARFEDAIESFDRATTLAPAALEPLLNRGVTQERSGRQQEAIDAWSKLLLRDPECTIARYYRSMAYLRLGRWQEGFADYESRLDLPDALPETLLRGKPKWDGLPLEGKTLLIFPEHGMGDMLQLLRYVPLCKAAGGRVMVCCHPPLVGLLATVGDIDVATANGLPLPEPFDTWISVMSLPSVCGHQAELPPLRLRVETIVRPEIASVKGLKVGVYRREKPSLAGDRASAATAGDLKRHLAGIEGIALFSLQADNAPSAWAPPIVLPMENFLAVAELVQQFDLVITDDADIAHLCGSLGLRTWVLVSSSPDWCWGMAGETTPWYPSVRTFRQSTPGDWSAPVTMIGDRLRMDKILVSEPGN